jgi:hypothetical protein
MLSTNEMKKFNTFWTSNLRKFNMKNNSEFTYYLWQLTTQSSNCKLSSLWKIVWKYNYFLMISPLPSKPPLIILQHFKNNFQKINNNLDTNDYVLRFTHPSYHDNRDRDMSHDCKAGCLLLPLHVNLNETHKISPSLTTMSPSLSMSCTQADDQ